MRDITNMTIYQLYQTYKVSMCVGGVGTDIYSYTVTGVGTDIQ